MKKAATTTNPTVTLLLLLRNSQRRATGLPLGSLPVTFSAILPQSSESYFWIQVSVEQVNGKGRYNNNHSICDHDTLDHGKILPLHSDKGEVSYPAERKN